MVDFTTWYPWVNRDSISGCQYGGVYLIGQFAAGKVPSGPANPFDPNVVNIGQSGGRKPNGEPSLGVTKNRLTSWMKSATTGKRGHKGGRTYHSKEGPAVPSTISVALLEFEVPSEIVVKDTNEVVKLRSRNDKRFFVAIHYGRWFLHVERDLLIRYKEQNNRLPLCNNEIPSKPDCR